jgi:hypothetical protein
MHTTASTPSSYLRSDIGTTVSSSEDLSGRHAHSSGDNPKRLKRPKLVEPRASAVDVSNTDTSTLDYKTWNAIEGGMDRNSCTLPIAADTSYEDLPEDLREEVYVELGPGTKEIADIFGELGLPLCTERLRRNDDSGDGKVRYHTAS